MKYPRHLTGIPGIDTDGKVMELFSESWSRVRKLWIEMCKILLGAMVILKVHDVYGKREVRPAQVDDEDED